MEEVHRHGAHLRALIGEQECGCVCAGRVPAELTEVAHLDIFCIAEGTEFFDVGRWHSEHHALLRFADPDFGVAEAGVFEGSGVECDASADLAAHFADGAGEAARTAIGDAAVEAAAFVVAGLKENIERFLLRDSVADLHSVAELVCVCVGQLSGREGRAVNTIAPCATAQRDDAIARLRLAETFVEWNDANTACKNEWISEVIFMKPDSPIDRGNAHAVAIIAHASHDALQDALGVDDAAGNGKGKF